MAGVVEVQDGGLGPDDFVIEKPSYISPWGLLPFQALGVAHALLKGSLMVVWDPGLGKSHEALAGASIMFDQGKIDLAIIVAEKNKIAEWEEDFQRFTTLTALRYHGTGRKKKLDKDGLPQVLITTYETGAADFAPASKSGNGRRYAKAGSLLLSTQSLRVLVIFDEVTRLKNRKSGIHISWEKALETWRAHGGVRVMGLTATPVEKDAEDYYNLLRLLIPSQVPSVNEFETEYVRRRDFYGNPSYYPEKLPEFRERFIAPIQIRKRKSDPDVRAQFPELVEDSTKVELSEEHARFYSLVRSLGLSVNGSPLDPPPSGLWTVLRQAAGYPEALALSQGQIATTLATALGRDYLADLGSPKMERLLPRLESIMSADAKAIVFTFFGQSILPLLARDLDRAGIETFVHHGGQTSREQEVARKNFRETRRPCVFLSSDAGSRGINLPEASYIEHFDAPLTYALYQQRLNRASRIGQGGSLLTSNLWVVQRSVEVAVVEIMMRRNATSDVLLGDADDAGEVHVLASDRRLLLGLAS